MTPQERQLVNELFERLAKLEGAPRDADASAVIAQGLSRAPNAIYALVQTVLLQEEALKRAAARIEELEGRAPAQEQQGGGFLDSMRGAIFGQQQRSGSVPSVRQSDDRAQWNTGATLQNDPRYAPPSPPDLRAQQGGAFGGGGSFLGTAAAAAAGVIGGSLLMNSIGGLMGGQRHGFGDVSAGRGSDATNPWSGDQSKGDLSREAGLNDIGRGSGRDADTGSRQGLFDQASNEHVANEDDYEDDSDDFDSGDSDYA